MSSKPHLYLYKYRSFMLQAYNYYIRSHRFNSPQTKAKNQQLSAKFYKMARIQRALMLQYERSRINA